MNEKELDPSENTTPEISVNEYGRTKDPAVVIDEADRTVLLTPDETIVIEKQPHIEIVPKNRPRSVYAGMWGKNEIATVAIGVMALLTVGIIYFFLVVPSNRQLERDVAEADKLQYDLKTANGNWNDNTSLESRVAKLLKSEENFETTYLPPVGSGRNALYQRLNGLIAAFGLVNTNGPEYAPLETVSVNAHNESGDERGRDKYRSLFPGIYVTMTVEGSYANLRRFIKELEAGQEFIVISSVQLEPSDNDKQEGQTSAPQQQQPPQAVPQVNYAQPGYPMRGSMGQPNMQPAPVDNTRPPSARGKTRGELVSLHLEMAAYFRRPDFAPVATQQQ